MAIVGAWLMTIVVVITVADVSLVPIKVGTIRYLIAPATSYLVVCTF